MKIVSDINLKSTLLSGQCFRVTEESDSSFTIVLSDRVVNVKRDNEYIIVKSNNGHNLKEVISDYLDLKRDYDSINNKLLLNNIELKDIIEYSKGYKILNQSKFEMLISYIISQNNTVKNISSCIEKISKKYGKRVLFNNNEYYLFPTYQQMKHATDDELRECKVGFRSKYIINALNAVNEEYLENIGKLSSADALESLMKIKGIGLKVASCILLFSYDKYDVFPIDTWVKKYFNVTNEKEIKKIASKKYKEYSGLAIQYAFHYSRNKNVL